MVTWRGPPSASGESEPRGNQGHGEPEIGVFKKKRHFFFFFFFAEEKGTDAQREAEMRSHMNPETIRECGA